MKQDVDLTQLGKEISDFYIKDHEDLTDSLVKTALEYGLNKQEMNRVAETANTETYLGLLKTANDNYIEFPLADSKKAFEKLDIENTKTAEISNDDLYENIESKNDFNFAMYGIDLTTEKTAEFDPAERYNNIIKLNDQLEIIDNVVDEETVSLNNDFDKIYNFVKQAMLAKETEFADIAQFIKVAGSDIGDYLLEDLKTKLKEELPTEEFEKIASNDCEINTDASLFKDITNYKTHVDNLVKLANCFSDIEKQFDEFTADNTYGIIKKATIGSKLGTTGKVLGGGLLLAFPALTFAAGAVGAKNNTAGDVLNKQNAIQLVNQERKMRM